jgi:XTP/dITP diphosphohydrolase
LISFVTSNQGKFREAKAILGDLVQDNIGYTEIQADSLEEVSAFGIREVVARLQKPCIVEDAGLFIEALKGFPGVYSAYVLKTIGNDGILKLLSGLQDRNAAFRSVVAYAEPGIEPCFFRGELQGVIGYEPRGNEGFGYDPIFYIDGRSLGEMGLEEKNLISHRARSMRALKSWLENR